MASELLWRCRRCYLGAGVVIFAAALILAAGKHVPYMTNSWQDVVNSGILFATVYSHPALAGAWTVLGRGPLWSRLLVAIAWIAFLPAAYVYDWLSDPLGWFPGTRDINHDYFGFTLIFQSVQWLLAVLLVGVLVTAFQLRLVHPADPPQPARNRFSMRQLLITMSIVGGVLALERSGVISLAPFETAYDFHLMFTLFGVFGALRCLPLALALLVPTRWKRAVAFALLFAAIATCVELLLIRFLPVRCFDPRTDYVVVPTELAWTILLAGVMRLGGFRLSTDRLDPQLKKTETMHAGETTALLTNHDA